MDPITRLPISFGLVAAYSPNDLNNLLQYALDEGETYNMTQFAGDDAHYLKDLRTDLGTLRAPLQGYVLNFDGTDDYGTKSSPTGIPQGGAARTMGAWVKPNTLTGEQPIIYCKTSSGQSFNFQVHGTTYFTDGVNAGNNITASGTFTMVTGVWQHLAMTLDASNNWKLFLDGVEGASGTFGTAINTGTITEIQLGRRNAAYFDGEIYDARIYDVEKTPAQIAAIHGGDSDRTNLVAGWWGNDKSGTKLKDRSGNGNDLIATNITQSTFHLVDATIVNPANSEGYSTYPLFGDSADSRVLISETLAGDFSISFTTQDVDSICYLFSGPTSSNRIFFNTLSDLRVVIAGFVGSFDVSGLTLTDKIDWVISRTGASVSVTANASLVGTLAITANNFPLSVIGNHDAAYFDSNPAMTGHMWDVVINGTTYLNQTGVESGATNQNVTFPTVPAVDDTTDALGNTLQYQGNAPFPIRADTPCITGDGTAVYADLGSALIPATADFSIELDYYHVTNNTTRKVVFAADDTSGYRLMANGNATTGVAGQLSFQMGGNSAIVSIQGLIEGWNHISLQRVGTNFTLTLNGTNSVGTDAQNLQAFGTSTQLLTTDSALYNDGRIASFSITTGGVTTTFPLQEGEGRDLGWWATDGTKGVVSGAIVGGSLANIWANLCPGLVKDHSILYGGGIDGVTGAFVPGDPNSANDVNGDPKTLPAGDFGNPHSRLQFNPFAVQEITAINGESDYVAGTFRHLVAPADTKYADTSTDGTSSTLISVSGALTGADKTNTETYVNIPAIPANMITIGGSTPITIDNTQYVVIGS